MNLVLFREVPVDSPVHRLWAGTKILGVAAISVVLMYLPSWPVLAAMTTFLIGVGVAARLPLGTLPRLPWWFWAMILAAGALNIAGGPTAVVRFAQVTVYGLILLAASFMIAWTTPMGEIAPALAKLGAPLRRLRIPVDEWAVVVALTLRGLPLLLEEMRVLRAARRLRPRDHRHVATRRPADSPMLDILTATMAVSTRRAGELGQAITARGGTGALTAHPDSPGRADVVALLIVAAVCGGSVALNLFLS
ncbi:energy-coupling factor transporter transmembrane component T family protein [Nocardia stercoris]|uniref:Energy-coupling factor transporter transmembrane protein EcfT n=1 Tax=Nocardia stercoris TaxID=2483361 RepID=A0A3M2KZI6_9NOCA|nr:energy-coupling factor transporter transmembrane protein EcfT [Nocardia stercoris]RMI29683.1 energy-coupling factor transporter transmembrane protein EcfT [Nocardia stercoris]